MNKRILIIDDDRYIRELYEEVLKNAGFVVLTAVDGEEGINKLKEGGYDLVLLDMMMPKVDGTGVMNELTQHPPKLKNGPIILLSNLGNELRIENALKLGASTYIVKSDITPDKLLEVVEKYLVK